MQIRTSILLPLVMLAVTPVCFIEARAQSPSGVTAAAGIGTLLPAPVMNGIAGGAASPTMVHGVPEDFQRLLIGPGFLLNVCVFDEPDLCSSARVSDHGDISLPLAGVLPVNGLNTMQVERAIASRYKSGLILNNPQVTVNVVEYSGTWVTVLGEVVHPGRIELLAAHNLADIIAAVGGQTVLASGAIDIQRNENGVETIRAVQYSGGTPIDTLGQVVIRPGDTIVARRAGIIYVLGAVNRPGGYIMQESGSLTANQALALAQGMTIAASVSSARVIRKGPTGAYQEIAVQFKDGMKGRVAPVALQAQDIVYVDVSKGKTIFTSTAGIVASTASASIIH